jgi:hypothetical protein
LTWKIWIDAYEQDLDQESYQNEQQAQNAQQTLQQPPLFQLLKVLASKIWKACSSPPSTWMNFQAKWAMTMTSL